MPVAVVPYMTTRMRTAPVAELSNVMAYNAPPRGLLAKAGGGGCGGQLTKRKSYASLHGNSALLLCGSSTNLDKKSSGASSATRAMRALELLRSALAAAQVLGGGELELRPEASAAAAAIDVAESIEPAARAFWGLTLDEQRAAFVAALRLVQHPHADVIGPLNLLLCNRAAIGLLSPASAADYNTTISSNSSSAVPIAIAGLARSAAACSLSSSLDSAESEATLAAESDAAAEPEGLFDLWASGGGFWRRRAGRGRRASSMHTAVAPEEEAEEAEAEEPRPAAMADHAGTCWPLDAAAGDAAARGWGRFYAELGGVRVPTRFRVPRHSLAMLAAEQLMMRNDKIVCPLKNRLQEPNPRRQRFEAHIHATGAVPPAHAHAHAQGRSPLHKKL
ncbi:hypothetical protein GGI00_003731 [Coemansia sp. RSA 2681]|nr:hypothetical protein GGI00_003731 [Coemansia sp. RSA 2681]